MSKVHSGFRWGVVDTDCGYVVAKVRLKRQARVIAESFEKEYTAPDCEQVPPRFRVKRRK